MSVTPPPHREPKPTVGAGEGGTREGDRALPGDFGNGITLGIAFCGMMKTTWNLAGPWGRGHDSWDVGPAPLGECGTAEMQRCPRGHRLPPLPGEERTLPGQGTSPERDALHGRLPGDW